MKIPVPPLLAASLHLLLSAFLSAQGVPSQPVMKAKADAAKEATTAQQKLQENAAQTRRGVETWLPLLGRRADPSPGIEKILRDQSRLATQLRRVEATTGWTSGLLVLAVILSAGGLLLGLRQRSSLMVLEQRLESLLETLGPWTLPNQRSASAKENCPLTPVASSSAVEIPQPSPSPRVSATEVMARGGGPALRQEGTAGLPLAPAAEPAVAGAGDFGFPTSEGDAEASPPLPFRHRKVAALLVNLRMAAPRLASSFGDPAIRERFQGEFDAPLDARLGRLRAVSEHAEGRSSEHWVVSDLVPTLDALARFYSEAVEEERAGR
ncbi:MAG: hypothetical protein M3O15_01310, partial [Acidobacteriota bacterium]|nr:hypothetical protein [Acidobacteriota bacterium]